MFKKVAIAVIISVFVFSMAKAEVKLENLLRNGDFGMVNSKGVPVGWQVSNTAEQKFSEDKTDKPAECANSIKVVIKNTHKYQGYISQYLKNIKPNTELILTAKTKSTMKRLAFLQIKLYKNKKELKRINTSLSTIKWQTLTKKFSSGEADAMVVLCRFSQAKKALNETVWFADIKLVKCSK
jgi:hypothetical protein